MSIVDSRECTWSSYQLSDCHPKGPIPCSYTGLYGSFYTDLPSVITKALTLYAGPLLDCNHDIQVEKTLEMKKME